MKTIQNPNYTIETNISDAESNKFSITVNSKSFKILFDSLYENKIQSIIRELCSNAYDSHVEAGIADCPFQVRLPNLLDATFAVRDYGVSMDHDHVMKLYTTVFHSSKDDTNELVGQLGLGSKSPFAYTDSFSVIAWKDGYKRSYVANIGEGEIPQITHLFTAESDEPTGVEVSFPVRTEHYNQFVSEFSLAMIGFDVQPEVVGAPELAIPAPTYAADNWRIYHQVYNRSYYGARKENNFPYYKGFSIRQGCVIYPLDFSKLSAIDAELLNLTRWFGLQHGAGIIIDVPIGSVNIAANRESLSLDETTVINLKRVFKTLQNSVKQYFQSEIKNCKTLISAQKLLYYFNNIFYVGSNHGGFRGVINSTEWRGQRVGHIVEIAADKSPVLLNSKDFNPVKSVSPSTNLPQRKCFRFPLHQLDALIFVVDKKSEKVVRRRRRVSSYRIKNNIHFNNIYVLEDPTNEQIKYLRESLDLRDNQIINVRDLPDITPVQKTGTTNTSSSSERGVYKLELRKPNAIRRSYADNYPLKVHNSPFVDSYYWLPIDSSEARKPYPLSWDLEYIFYVINEHLTLAPILAVPTRKILLLTPQAQKRADPDNNFHVAVGAIWNKKKDLIRKNLTDAHFVQDLSMGIVSNRHHDALVRHFKLVPNIASLTILFRTAVIREIVFTAPEYDTIVSEAKKRAAEAQKEYPMMYVSPSYDEIRTYLNRKDSNE